MHTSYNPPALGCHCGAPTVLGSWGSHRSHLHTWRHPCLCGFLQGRKIKRGTKRKGKKKKPKRTEAWPGAACQGTSLQTKYITGELRRPQTKVSLAGLLTCSPAERALQSSEVACPGRRGLGAASCLQWGWQPFVLLAVAHR